MLKRAGQGQDPAGVNATEPGELAVECPACPHPGRNLPEHWDSTGPLSCVLSEYETGVVQSLKVVIDICTHYLWLSTSAFRSSL